MDCQVRGCDEPSQGWGMLLDVDDLPLVVFVCARHERDFYGIIPLAEEKPPRAAPLPRRGAQ